MLHGQRVTLRARLDADVPVLHAELHDDVETRSRADSRPWGAGHRGLRCRPVCGPRALPRRRVLLGGGEGQRRARRRGAALEASTYTIGWRTSGCHCARASAAVG